jgi:hypothetical protein
VQLSPILTQDGKAVANFGGSQAWKTRPVKDYMASWEWRIDPDNPKRTDGVLVLWTSHGDPERGVWVISRRAAGLFSDPHNRPEPHAFKEAWEALPVLGRNQIKLEVHHLVDVLMDCIDDLVQMPRTPPRVADSLKHEPIFEIIRRDQDRKVLEQTEV